MCCGDFNTQRSGAAQPLQGLEAALQERVVRRLVVSQVIVRPARQLRQRVEQRRGEIHRQQLDLLVDVERVHVVHRVEQRQDLLAHRELVTAALDARVLGARRHALPGARDGLQRFPVLQRAQPVVGGDQVQQVRGSRARQAGDHQRRADLDLVYLRMLAVELLEAAALHQVAHQHAEQRQPSHRAEVGVLVHRGTEYAEALAQPRIIVERDAVQLGRGGLADRLDGEVDRDVARGGDEFPCPG